MVGFPRLSHINKRAELQHRWTALCSDDPCRRNVVNEGHLVAEAHDDAASAASDA